MVRAVVWGYLFAVSCWILAATFARAQPWQSSSAPRPTEFVHPPLLYEGPDPTANEFMPVPSVYDARLSARPPSLQLDAAPAEFAVPPQSFPEQSLESFLPDSLYDPQSGLETGVTDHKHGFFQKLSFTAGWIDRNKADGYALTETDLFGTFAVPLPSRDWPLLLTPTFNVRHLDGPATIDLPSRLYESYFDMTWLPKWHSRWLGIIGVAPGVYSDFEQSSKAFRLTGRALIRYDWTPDRLQLLFGVLYLSRDDVQWLPAGGIIWAPSPNRRYEILFPKPTLAHRYKWGPGFEDWVYLAGEFGGNSYAIERLSGAADRITLRDYRIFLGLKRKHDGGAGFRIEMGYVMGRAIEFDSNTPDVQADATALLRGGVMF